MNSLGKFKMPSNKLFLLWFRNSFFFKRLIYYRYMESSFSKALALSGTNPTTSLVLWSMIIFLFVLIIALGFALIKQLQSRAKSQQYKPPKKLTSKGF